MNNVNFDLVLKDIINKIDYTPRLLLHSCCGPCSSYVINYLTKYFDISVLYYNPCIEPDCEYYKRKSEQIRLIGLIDTVNKLDFVECEYDNEAYRNLIAGYENDLEGGSRCSICFSQRLRFTRDLAVSKGFDYFGTTLSVSPHKNSKLINSIGESLEGDVKFLYSDFKKNDGYKKSTILAKEYDLYRQNYCGCLFSKNIKDSDAL